MRNRAETEFKISEIAGFYGMTPRTLRYYEEIGLLRPARVDSSSAYRYYGRDSIERLEAISQLKGMGLTLDEIRECLIGRFSVFDKIEQCKTEISILNFKLKELEFLDTKRGHYVADVIDAPSRTTLARELKAKSHADLIDNFYAFIEEMISQKVKLMSLKRYFIELVDGKFVDGDPLVRIHANIAADRSAPAGTALFKGRKYISTCHRGTWREISNAFEFLLEYADKNGMKPDRPAMISYVNGTFFTDSPDNLVTIGIPVD